MAFTADQEATMVLRWMRGREDAARVFRDVAAASQIADDIVDEDLSLERRAAHMAKLWALLVTLPANPFYAQHFDRLHPLILTAVFDWEASNEWQASDNRDDQIHGYVRREALERVMHFCAYIVGGPDWAMQVVREVQRFYHVEHADGETFETWCAEVEAGASAGGTA